MKYRLVQGNCLEAISAINVPDARNKWHTAFADPPDNIGIKYDGYIDKLGHRAYISTLERTLLMLVEIADTVWFSFNARWIKDVSRIVATACRLHDLKDKFCVQTFTFGQHNHHDLGNNMRPLWRLRCKDAFHDPNAIRVQSARQRMGDPRADPRGRVPGDVFDFPRVVGNSAQRKRWHPTQLHEGLVERCLRLSTPTGGTVFDPFGGTGTTMRAAIRSNMHCDLIEIDPAYCLHIAVENKLKGKAKRQKFPLWSREFDPTDPAELPLFGGEQDHTVHRS